jgi:hypothetical protein
MAPSVFCGGDNGILISDRIAERVAITLLQPKPKDYCCSDLENHLIIRATCVARQPCCRTYRRGLAVRAKSGARLPHSRWVLAPHPQ